MDAINLLLQSVKDNGILVTIGIFIMVMVGAVGLAFYRMVMKIVNAQNETIKMLTEDLGDKVNRSTENQIIMTGLIKELSASLNGALEVIKLFLPTTASRKGDKE